MFGARGMDNGGVRPLDIYIIGRIGRKAYMSFLQPELALFISMQHQYVVSLSKILSAFISLTQLNNVHHCEHY